MAGQCSTPEPRDASFVHGRKALSLPDSHSLKLGAPPSEGSFRRRGVSYRRPRTAVGSGPRGLQELRQPRRRLDPSRPPPSQILRAQSGEFRCGNEQFPNVVLMPSVVVGVFGHVGCARDDKTSRELVTLFPIAWRKGIRKFPSHPVTSGIALILQADCTPITYSLKSIMKDPSTSAYNRGQ
jgi:hypothetical protein